MPRRAPPPRHVFRVLTFHSPIPQIFPEHLLGAWPCRHGVSQKPQTYLLPIRSSQFGVKETHTPISMLERPQTSAQGWVGLQGEEGFFPRKARWLRGREGTPKRGVVCRWSMRVFPA